MLGNWSFLVCQAAIGFQHGTWILPWRDCPSWGHRVHPRGCRGRSSAPRQHRPWGEQGLAVRPRARPALTWKRSWAPGGAEKPRVPVFTAAEAAAAAGAGQLPAGAQDGGSTVPLPGGDAAPETPGQRAAWDPPQRRGWCVRVGGYNQTPLLWPPQGSAWPLQGQGDAVSASTKAGVSCPPRGPQGGCTP